MSILNSFISRLLTLSLGWALACLLSTRTSYSQQPIHRYSFDVDAQDVVGTAHGELVGDATIVDGAVRLSGQKPSYVNLPNDLVTTLTNATLEVWLSWSGGAAWQRIWDFGNNDNGEDLQGVATQSIFLTPNNGSVMDLSIFTNGIGGQQVINVPPLPQGGVHQVVWTCDAAAKIGRLYLDGREVGINSNLTYTLAGLGPTMNNWLGHSQYPDSDFFGSIAEFRIYDLALTAAQVAANYASGPDPAGRGALVTLHLEGRSAMRPGAGQQLRVTADYEKVAGLSLTSDPGVSYQVSDPAVLAIDAAGVVTAIGSGAGTATITASYGGKSATLPVEVLLPAPALLLHRYSFASDASDSVGTAHGKLVGDATIVNGAAVLSGNKPSYVDLPNDLVSTLTNATFEIWANWNGGPAWQRIIDFGNSGAAEDEQGAATQSIFLTPNNGAVMDLSIFPDGIGGQQVLNAPPLTPGILHHIVWTYDALATLSSLYLDGNVVGVNSNMTYTLAGLGSTVNNWLGHSQYVQDSDFAGSIAEFRIYNGVMDASTVKTNTAVGPDPSGRGNLLAIHLNARPKMLAGLSQQVEVTADFEKVAGVTITSDPSLSFQVSDPAVLSVSNSGKVTVVATSAASADVTATYQGKSAASSVQVILPAPPVLLHRYAFEKDASDSVGNADGELVGDAIITNGVVALSGNKPSYVNLPNDLVSTLTNATLELWVTWNGGAVWQRILDFGNSGQEEDLQGAATQSIFITPNNGGVLDVSIFPDGIGGQQVINAPPLNSGVRYHLVWSYSAPATTARLFVDGQEVGANYAMTYTLAGLGSTANNWLGHSQYVQDGDFAGSIAEFRIYDGTFSDREVAASFAAGPDNLPGDAVQLVVAKAGGQIQFSWPASATGFGIESATSLGSGAVWSAVAANPAVVNGQFQATVTAPGATTFYRLKK
ncbi:MAG: LamG domain-containing protein [Verrucomicrobiota bacterium]